MKGTFFKKVLSFLLIVSTLASILLFTSCDRKYDEDEVIEAAGNLLKQAEVLNEVYYGKGISYISSSYQDGSYYEADPMHLASLGFSTVEELKKLTLATFTAGYSNEIFSTKLDMIYDNTGVREMARYFQRYDDVNMTEPVCIMVYANAKILKKGTIVYDYSSLRVTDVEKETVYVAVNATVYDDNGNSQKTTITLSLIEEDNGWRIDNPCYANYNSAKDHYNDLNK